MYKPTGDPRTDGQIPKAFWLDNWVSVKLYEQTIQWRYCSSLTCFLIHDILHAHAQMHMHTTICSCRLALQLYSLAHIVDLLPIFDRVSFPNYQDTVSALISGCKLFWPQWLQSKPHWPSHTDHCPINCSISQSGLDATELTQSQHSLIGVIRSSLFLLHNYYSHSLTINEE